MKRGSWLVACLLIGAAACVNPVPAGAQKQKVTANVHFHVLTGQQGIRGARVIVVGDDGKVIGTALTDEKGDVDIPVTVSRDPRFLAYEEPLGTVTAITVADGYNESVTFEVPVTKSWGQTVFLEKVVYEQRNEPSAYLGNLHRFMYWAVLDQYAKRVGLARQKQVDSSGYAPWSPKIQQKKQ